MRNFLIEDALRLSNDALVNVRCYLQCMQLLRVPVPLIVALVVGRKIYKECVGYQVAEDFNKPHSHIMFFLASYICGLARR